ncbi:MAG: hypothetical protein AAF702_19920 [Chloroflexota bacterium]
MKIIIAGGRDFDNYTLLKQEADRLTADLENLEIVSGCALSEKVCKSASLSQRTASIYTQFRTELRYKIKS